MLVGPLSTSQGPSGKDFGSKLSKFGATHPREGSVIAAHSCGHPVLIA